MNLIKARSVRWLRLFNNACECSALVRRVSKVKQVPPVQEESSALRCSFYLVMCALKYGSGSQRFGTDFKNVEGEKRKITIKYKNRKKE